jgi:hypothetical protein
MIADGGQRVYGVECEMQRLKSRFVAKAAYVIRVQHRDSNNTNLSPNADQHEVSFQ